MAPDSIFTGICGGSAALSWNGRDVHWVAAYGRGGQSIHIVPELDLVVVITAGYYQNYSPRAQQVVGNIFRDVLRATSRRG
jgi:CubicO group peptidase (beta-lactamase class C family)